MGLVAQLNWHHITIYQATRVDSFSGFLFSFGVFQEYYSKTEPFASEASGVALIGTCATVSSWSHWRDSHPH